MDEPVDLESSLIIKSSVYYKLLQERQMKTFKERIERNLKDKASTFAYQARNKINEILKEHNISETYTIESVKSSVAGILQPIYDLISEKEYERLQIEFADKLTEK